MFVTERTWNIFLLYINNQKLSFINFTILRTDISNSRNITVNSNIQKLKFFKIEKEDALKLWRGKNKDPIWHSEKKRKWISFCHIMKKNELLLKVIYKLQFMIYKCLYLLLAFAIEARQITVRIL